MVIVRRGSREGRYSGEGGTGWQTPPDGRDHRAVALVAGGRWGPVAKLHHTIAATIAARVEMATGASHISIGVESGTENFSGNTSTMFEVTHLRHPPSGEGLRGRGRVRGELRRRQGTPLAKLHFRREAHRVVGQNHAPARLPRPRGLVCRRV